MTEPQDRTGATSLYGSGGNSAPCQRHPTIDTPSANNTGFEAAQTTPEDRNHPPSAKLQRPEESGLNVAGRPQHLNSIEQPAALNVITKGKLTPLVKSRNLSQNDSTRVPDQRKTQSPDFSHHDAPEPDDQPRHRNQEHRKPDRPAPSNEPRTSQARPAKPYPSK